MKNKKYSVVRLLSVMLVLIQIFVFSIPNVSAADLDTPVDSLEQNVKQLYSAEPITDVVTLEARADQKIDDLLERRGISFDTAVSAPENFEVDVKYTSQLVSVYEVDGEIVEDYVVSAVSDIITNSNSNTGSGYRVVTSVRFAWKDYTWTAFKLIESTASYSVVGSTKSAPKRMTMRNEIYEGWLTNVGYQNVNGVANPVANNTYYLASGYSGWVDSNYAACCRSCVSLFLVDGTEIQVEVDGGPDINWS